VARTPDVDRIRRWMFASALPFWAERGLDRTRGGYVEKLTLASEDAAAPFKRTRVTCRQVYVFSHAFELGWNQGRDLAVHGINFLVERTWQGDAGGFARCLSRDGERLDLTPDLYDQAFALFAFAWHYRTTSDERSRDWMHRTLDFIEQYMRHPSGLGFCHEIPARGWRLQNPHMHLAEACLASFDATGERRFRDIACELGALFESRFFDPKSSTLAEYFCDDWTRAPGEPGRITEPGHQLEWAWILNSCRKAFGLDLADTIRRCVAFAEQYGVDPSTGAVYNAVRDDGLPIDRSSRTWPNTERLKAAVALSELDGNGLSPAATDAVSLLFNRYLDKPVAGAWLDAFDSEGRSTSDHIPTSTLYHIFLAFAEVLRISS
jgi:mannose/cellobiose epimerase-like protein (N-acyl-D-glucosamine 2-epimerase family)